MDSKKSVSDSDCCASITFFLLLLIHVHRNRPSNQMLKLSVFFQLAGVCTERRWQILIDVQKCLGHPKLLTKNPNTYDAKSLYNVSDRFGPDCFGFRIVSNRLRIVSERFPTVSDDSTLEKIIKFQLAKAGARDGPTPEPTRAVQPQPWPIEIWIFFW